MTEAVSERYSLVSARVEAQEASMHTDAGVAYVPKSCDFSANTRSRLAWQANAMRGFNSAQDKRLGNDVLGRL